MSSVNIRNVNTRNIPATYQLLRIALELDEENNIVATADMTIRNAAGMIIDDDHPSVVLSPGEATAFKTWVLGELDTYEAAFGLTRYVPPPEIE